MRMNAAAMAGLFDEKMKMMGDVDFFLRVLKYGNLAVVKNVGCKIFIHPKQAGAILGQDASTMLEICDLVERHRVLLINEGFYDRIKEQFAAYSLAMAFKNWRLRAYTSCQAHIAIAAKMCASRLAVFRSLIRIFIFRMLLRIVGVRILPVSRLEPIEFLAISSGNGGALRPQDDASR